MAVSIPSIKFAGLPAGSFGSIAEKLLRVIGLPLAGLATFLLVWHLAAAGIETSLGKFPGPAQVLTQVEGLYAEHREEKQREADFYERQEKRNTDVRVEVAGCDLFQGMAEH